MEEVEAEGSPPTGLAEQDGHSGHEFQLQDLQGQGKSLRSELLSRTTAQAGLEDGHLAETSEQNNIDPQGRLEEVEAPEGSPGTRLEQDGQ
ncbi:hypothetical protein CY35_04G098600 [Sphagnum magellanicum]|nr:hypothetical protein CY35_04G098600 [Sphagnum magellanicum]KAH9565848.1 hypothetical protein CY35_04G098600 [Sphagnum magellanicum]KAH9565849.1 hypothetical protein CY35_04G098600 [Sphagnum magellanicum]